MFCNICGSKIENGDKVCGRCGADISGQTEENWLPASGNKKTFRLSGNTRKIVIAAAIILTLAVVAVTASVSGLGRLGARNYETAVSNFVEALGSVDAKLYYRTVPGFYNAYINNGEDFSRRELIGEYEAVLHEMLAGVKNDCGRNITGVSYELTSVEFISEEVIDENIAFLIKRLGVEIDRDSVTQMNTAYITVTFTGSKGVTARDYILCCYEIDGRWYAMRAI